LRTAVFTHAPADHEFALQLAEFLEFGCDLTCFVDDGLIAAGHDLISKAEDGFCADVCVVLLSPHSCPPAWPRQRWEPALCHRPKQEGVEVVTVLLQECTFPPLFRKRNFVDATEDQQLARRLLKRWFWQWQRQSGDPASSTCSEDLEDLYRALADAAGTLHVRGAEAQRFATEAAEEFEAVLWAACAGRTLAQAAGELSNQLELKLDGHAKENCERIRNALAAHRCLVVLDGADAEISSELVAGGRSSTAITKEAVKILQTPETPAYARTLIAAKRYAEAYELLYRLLDMVIEPDWCARELAWICDHWGRVEEGNALRRHDHAVPVQQLALF
jgi:hypothetical protein